MMNSTREPSIADRKTQKAKSKIWSRFLSPSSPGHSRWASQAATVTAATKPPPTSTP